MYRRIVVCTGLLCALAAVLSGCGSGGEEALASGPSETIGLAMPTTTAPRWTDDANNMKKQFALLGYRTEITFAQDKPQTQVQQIETMIAHHDKALIITAVDGPALTDVLAKAAAAEIPVISYDRLIRDTPNISYYASFDNYRVGVLQGNYLIRTLHLKTARNPLTIELFAGDPKDNNAGFFFGGAMSVLRPYLRSGALDVRSGQKTFAQVATPGWVNATAQKRMANILTNDYANQRLDAVLAPNDGISRAAVASLQKAGYGTKNRPLPATTGQDAELDSVKAIIAGKQGQTVYKDSRELAKVAVQMTDSLLSGGQPEVNDTKQYNNGVKDVPSFLLQPVSVDKKNLKSVLVDGGAFTAEQIGT